MKTGPIDEYWFFLGIMAVLALVQKTLVAIYQFRIERRAGKLYDCDASGCYERILTPLESAHLQALGSRFLSFFIFSCWQQNKC